MHSKSKIAQWITGPKTMKQKFSFVRLLVFAVVGLPIGFIFTSLGFAISGTPIIAQHIFPWAAGIAVVIGLLGGFWRNED